VAEVLKNYIKATIGIEEVLARVSKTAYSQGLVRKINARLDAKKEELRRNNEYRLSLHESYADGIICREDFINFKSKYDMKIQEAEAAITSIKEEAESQSHDRTGGLRLYENFHALTRKMAVSLLDKVYVHENGRITVCFHFSAEFEPMKEVA
jgi:urease accessory protein UreF